MLVQPTISIDVCTRNVEYMYMYTELERSGRHILSGLIESPDSIDKLHLNFTLKDVLPT